MVLGRLSLQQYEQNIRSLQAKIHYNKMDASLLDSKRQALQTQLQQKEAYIAEIQRSIQGYDQQVSTFAEGIPVVESNCEGGFAWH